MGVNRTNTDQFQLRLPPGLRERIKAYADRHGRSMNTEIVRLLEREFPEPVSIERRIGDLLDSIAVLKDGNASDARIESLVQQIEDTVEGIYSGRVRGLDELTRQGIRSSVDQWRMDHAENEHENVVADLDDEEIASLQRIGSTEKFEDPFGE